MNTIICTKPDLHLTRTNHVTSNVSFVLRFILAKTVVNITTEEFYIRAFTRSVLVRNVLLGIYQNLLCKPNLCNEMSGLWLHVFTRALSLVNTNYIPTPSKPWRFHWWPSTEGSTSYQWIPLTINTLRKCSDLIFCAAGCQLGWSEMLTLYEVILQIALLALGMVISVTSYGPHGLSKHR